VMIAISIAGCPGVRPSTVRRKIRGKGLVSELV